MPASLGGLYLELLSDLLLPWVEATERAAIWWFGCW